MWNTFDFNGSGTLSLAEIDRACLVALPQFYKHKSVLMRAYKAADKSNDGYIEFSEFEGLIKLLVYYEKVWEKFEKLDKSGDRRLTFDELKEGHDILGLPRPSDLELKQVFDEMDENHGGYVLFDEFCIYFSKRLASPPSSTGNGHQTTPKK